MILCLKNTKLETLKITGLLWMILQISVSSAQILTDLNPHIKTDDPKETIVHTALKKGFVSIKAEVELVNGELKSLGGLNFEDLYLQPLFNRYQENGGRIYQNYLGLFYLFIDINGDRTPTLKALEQTLVAYEKMIAGFEGNSQRNPLKVVLIHASPKLAKEIMNKESSLISLEGDHSHLDQPVHFRKMPVVGLNYDLLDRELLRNTAKRLHRKGKKLRLYNVPRDQVLWESLVDSGADFINSKESLSLLSKSN